MEASSVEIIAAIGGALAAIATPLVAWLGFRFNRDRMNFERLTDKLERTGNELDEYKEYENAIVEWCVENKIQIGETKKHGGYKRKLREIVSEISNNKKLLDGVSSRSQRDELEIDEEAVTCIYLSNSEIVGRMRNMGYEITGGYLGPFTVVDLNGDKLASKFSHEELRKLLMKTRSG